VGTSDHNGLERALQIRQEEDKFICRHTLYRGLDHENLLQNDSLDLLSLPRDPKLTGLQGRAFEQLKRLDDGKASIACKIHIYKPDRHHRYAKNAICVETAAYYLNSIE